MLEAPALLSCTQQTEQLELYFFKKKKQTEQHVEEIGCVRDGAIWDGRPGRSSTRISKNNRKIQTNHHFRSPGHTFLGCKTGVSRCHQSAVCFRASRSTCLTGNPAIWQQIEEVGRQRIGGDHITSHHIKQITQETTANQILI